MSGSLRRQTQGSKFLERLMRTFGEFDPSQQGTKHWQTRADQTETFFNHAPIKHGSFGLVEIVIRVETPVGDNEEDYHPCNGSSGCTCIGNVNTIMSVTKSEITSPNSTAKKSPHWSWSSGRGPHCR
uniref:Serine/threonine-protein kinase AtPK2/AtPK19 n=1 Tax=Talaromyces marneffei PM1 TaxID=1077442 RepID=A0A093VS05_TALMA